LVHLAADSEARSLRRSAPQWMCYSVRHSAGMDGLKGER
jgi:hypothetical protein